VTRLYSERHARWFFRAAPFSFPRFGDSNLSSLACVGRGDMQPPGHIHFF